MLTELNTLDRLNALALDAAKREFLRCCGSQRWTRQMAVLRPFGSHAEMIDAAEALWSKLLPADWMEAFSQHKVASASGQLAEGYFRRFGFPFIAYTDSHSPQDLETVLKERLENDPAEELLLACEAQKQITRAALRRL